MLNLYDRSLEIIRAGQASSGAYVASPTFSQYGYSWLRDGTWIAYAMDCVQQHDSARTFYQWVGRTLLKHQNHCEALLQKLAKGETPAESDYLPTRFTLKGETDGLLFWENFQLDGYGTWLWGVVQHVKMTGNAALWESLLPAVEMTIRYLAALWQSPNYDCWEEHRQQIHPATLAAIYAGLNAVTAINPALVPPDLAEKIRAFVLENAIAKDEHVMKYVGNPAVDASLLWVATPCRLLDIHDPIFQKTVAKIEQDLYHPGGGVYRYRADTYYGGGEWLLLAAWLGWVYLELGRITEAQVILRWIESQANATGELPEQVSQHLLDSSRYAEWENKWGTIACPLLWSHAMYLILRTKLESC